MPLESVAVLEAVSEFSAQKKALPSEQITDLVDRGVSTGARWFERAEPGKVYRSLLAQIMLTALEPIYALRVAQARVCTYPNFFSPRTTAHLIAVNMSWRKIPITLNELCIDTTLRCGQSFRWKKSPADGSYSCAFKGRLISLKQDATHLHYRTIHSKTSARNLLSTSRPSGGRSATVKVENDDEGQATVEFLQHYLNLGPNLEELYEQWSSSDPNFKKKAPKFTGVRILRQDAWEALVGFICSSNNNIARISQMVRSFIYGRSAYESMVS